MDTLKTKVHEYLNVPGRRTTADSLAYWVSASQDEVEAALAQLEAERKVRRTSVKGRDGVRRLMWKV